MYVNTRSFLALIVAGIYCFTNGRGVGISHPVEWSGVMGSVIRDSCTYGL